MKPPKDFGKHALEIDQTHAVKNKRVKRTMLRISSLVVVAVIALVFWGDITSVFASSSPGKTKVKGESSNTAVSEVGDPAITVLKKWDLPKSLKEISGLSYVDDQRLACVQDELGTIYVFNISTATIEKEIPFAPAGDYEGLAVVGEDIWVMRADGKLFEVSNINSSKPSTKEYSTHLTAAQDCEGLCYDKKNNRLLVTVKEKDPNSTEYKGIYAFDLNTKEMASAPVFKLDLKHEVFAGSGGAKKKGKAGGIMPSAIAINPVNNDMYITDGPKSRLLVTDKNGSIKKLYQLDDKVFPQPEGIIFNPAGELFISNEGPKEAGNILKVEVAAE